MTVRQLTAIRLVAESVRYQVSPVPLPDDPQVARSREMPLIRRRRDDHEILTLSNAPNPSETSQTPGPYLSKALRPSWVNSAAFQGDIPERIGSQAPLPKSNTAAFYFEPPEERVGPAQPEIRNGHAPSRILGTWDGIVLSIGPRTFKARVAAIGADRPEQAAEFSLSDVSDEDSDLFRPGALFYWTISYRDLPYGRVGRLSEIRFRRLPDSPRASDELDWVAGVKGLFESNVPEKSPRTG